LAFAKDALKMNGRPSVVAILHFLGNLLCHRVILEDAGA
jgi:hypothetical protein